MKNLGFISNPLISANRVRSWEIMLMAVEFLFIGIQHETLGDRLNQEQFGEINYDFGYAKSGLHSALKLKPRSGGYKRDAVPIKN